MVGFERIRNKWRCAKPHLRRLYIAHLNHSKSQKQALVSWRIMVDKKLAT